MWQLRKKEQPLWMLEQPISEELYEPPGPPRINQQEEIFVKIMESVIILDHRTHSYANTLLYNRECYYTRSQHTHM